MRCPHADQLLVILLENELFYGIANIICYPQQKTMQQENKIKSLKEKIVALL